MTDLQITLFGAGGVFIVGVFSYNKWQEYKAKKSVERAFSTDHDDVLMREGEAPAADAQEPVLRQEPRFDTAPAAPAVKAEPSFARRPCPPWPHAPVARGTVAGRCARRIRTRGRAGRAARAGSERRQRTGNQPGRPADRLPAAPVAGSARARRQDPARAANPAPGGQQARALHRLAREWRLGTDHAWRCLHEDAGRRAAGQPQHGPE